jgi:hypothetical protein
LWLLVLPKIEVHLLLLFLFPLALRRGLIWQDSALPDGADQLHDLLGLVLGREEAALGLRGTAEGHLLLDGGEVFDGIGIRVLDVTREKTHLNPANDLQLFFTRVWSVHHTHGVRFGGNLREVKRIAGVHIRQPCPPLRQLDAVEQTLERIARRGAHDFLAIDVVADMRVAGEAEVSTVPG